MTTHRYRITVQPAGTDPALVFEVEQHDDLFRIIGRMRGSGLFDAQTAATLAVGLKLFTGVMLRHRSDALFAEVWPAMRAFTGNLKARVDALASTTSGAAT